LNTEIDFELLLQDTKPLYEQIYDYLNNLIKTNELNPGEKLPSEKELGSQFNVSKITIRRAIQELVYEKKVIKIPGKGSFVLKPRIEPLTALTSFREDMIAQGYEPSYHSSRISHTVPHSKISEYLQIKRNEQVLNINRLMLADNIPMAIMDSYLPGYLYEKNPGFFTPEIMNQLSLYKILEFEFGIRLYKADEWVDASNALQKEAKILGIKKDDPILIIERISYTVESIPIEYVKMVYPAKRYRYKVQLFRTQRNTRI
jgi:GntR family transcriptional regulator